MDRQTAIEQVDTNNSNRSNSGSSNDQPARSRFFAIRVAKAAVERGASPSVVAAVFLGALVDVAANAPVFIGAAVLWGYLAVVQWQKPMLLWVIVLLWFAAAVPPTRWALEALQAARASAKRR